MAALRSVTLICLAPIRKAGSPVFGMEAIRGRPYEQPELSGGVMAAASVAILDLQRVEAANNERLRARLCEHADAPRTFQQEQFGIDFADLCPAARSLAGH